ncbi:MAG TPA: P-loop NTPase fold protein [Pyrinomonadaceae bacterium]|nr:P-loop NTPase fold protein [Pyrinomonadaceae bacterium]
MVTAGQNSPRLILPVLWHRPEQVRAQLPRAVSDIKYINPELGEEYVKNGLEVVMQMGRETAYQKFLIHFSASIVSQAEKYPLPPMPNPPQMSEVGNAFLRDESPTTKRPSKAKAPSKKAEPPSEAEESLRADGPPKTEGPLETEETPRAESPPESPSEAHPQSLSESPWESPSESPSEPPSEPFPESLSGSPSESAAVTTQEEPDDSVPVKGAEQYALSGAAGKVFERAKVLAANGPGRVNTACLLFAIDFEGAASTSKGIRSFLHEWFVAASPERYERVTNYYFRRRGDNAAVETMSPNALEALSAANDFAKLTPNDGKIYSRHLIAALLFHRPGGRELGAQKELGELGVDPLALREGFLDALQTRGYAGDGEGRDSLAVWENILFPERAGARQRMPGFRTDVYTDEDLLGIDKDVEAFATLIAARAVSPPLSIALFGDWGSGKSFFMRRLIKRVDKITEDARLSGMRQGEIGFYKRVAQIEFNAWHYVEGNLWASLVENIFQNLKISQSESNEDDSVKERRKAMLNNLKVEEAAQAKVEALKAEAEAKLRAKNREIERLEGEHREKTEALARLSGEEALALVGLSIRLDPAVESQIDEVLKAAGVKPLGDAAKDLQSALREARAVYERGSNLLTPMLRAPDGRQRFVGLLIVLLAAPLAGFAAGYVVNSFGSQLANLSAYVTGAATLLTTGAAWVRRQAAWTSERLKRVEEVKLKVDKQAEEKLAALRAENAKEMAARTHELGLLKTQYAALLGERAEVEKRIEQINAELRQSTAVQLLAKFIQDRAASDDYRKHLGLLALVRRDFSDLSDLIQKGNRELNEARDAAALDEKKEEEVAPVNRIVLYIDDLDRCPHEKVVAVLQAVHLLLAFPLFVVVVGVDGRWVAQSLRKGYPGLLGRDERAQGESAEAAGATATPHDYLEKIFQIPFWLNPLEEDSTKQMLRKLMPLDKVPPAPAAAAADVSGAGGGAGRVLTFTSDDTGVEVEDEPDTPAAPRRGGVPTAEDSLNVTGWTVTTDAPSSGGGAAVAQSAASKFNLNPDGLDIVSDEIEFVEKLTPLLGRSPRSVKRFINIYRLIKVGLAPAEAASFLDGTSPVPPFKAVLFLLTVATGMPSISRDLFQTLMRVHEGLKRVHQNADAARGEVLTVEGLLKRASRSTNPPPDSEWGRLREWLNSHDGGEWGQAPVDVLAAWSHKVARYSFNIRQGIS